jgi:hypothetical protein
LFFIFSFKYIKMKLNNSICIGILLILGLVIIYILNKPKNIEKFVDTVVETSPDVTTGFDATPTPGMTTGSDATPTPGMTTGSDVTPTPGMTTGSDVTPTPGMTTGSYTTPTPGMTTGPIVTPTPGMTTGPIVTPTPGMTTGPIVTPTPGMTTGPIVTPTPGMTTAEYQNNTVNPNSTTVTTAPPPSFHTQSINDMNKLGLYTLGKSNITQVGGEGPNNYFQPNIFIKRKPTVSPQSPSSNNTMLLNAGNTSNTANIATISQYWTDYSYGVEGGYNFAQPPNTTSDPISTAEQNARANYQREQELNGSCRNCVPASPDFETFGDNTPPGQFTHSCQMKEFVPGYQIQPPKCWDVPAKIPPVCLGNNERLPSAVFDRGTPLNALNLDTSVGSIMPKFRYAEESRT